MNSHQRRKKRRKVTCFKVTPVKLVEKLRPTEQDIATWAAQNAYYTFISIYKEDT